MEVTADLFVKTPVRLSNTQILNALAALASVARHPLPFPFVYAAMLFKLAVANRVDALRAATTTDDPEIRQATEAMERGKKLSDLTPEVSAKIATWCRQTDPLYAHADYVEVYTVPVQCMPPIISGVDLDAIGFIVRLS